MNIAVLPNVFPKLSKTWVLNQITGLIDRGHEVEIIAKSPSSEGKVHKDVSNYNLKSKTIYNGIPANRLGQVKVISNTMMKSLMCNPNYMAHLLRKSPLPPREIGKNMIFSNPLMCSNYDIIHAHFGPVGKPIADLKTAGVINSPLVTSFHGWGIRKGRKEGGNIYRKLFNESDVILANSKNTKQALLDFGAPEEKLQIHHIGIDPSVFEPTQNDLPTQTSEDIRILSVGNLVDEKGHKDGIVAVSDVIEQFPEIDLEYRIIGKGPLKDKLSKEITKREMGDHITLCGGMTRSEIIPEMHRANILLHPSRSEAFGMVLIEAQAAELPVVATNVGGIPDAVIPNQSAKLTPPGDVEGLKESLCNLISQRKERQEMGTIGREYVKGKYNINKLNNNLVEIYKHVKI